MSQNTNENTTIASLILAPLRAMKRGGMEAVRAEFSARPWAGVWVVMGYYASFGLISLLAWHYLKTGRLNPGQGLAAGIVGSVIAWLAYLALNMVLLPLYGWLIRYGLRRVLGAAMPQEPCPLGVPVGVWLGLAFTAPILCLLPLLYVAMGVQPWLPDLGTLVQSGFKTLGIVAYVIPLVGVRMIYRIPPRSAAWRRLGVIVVGPWIALALVGVVVAIVLGLHQKHDRIEIEAANSISSTSRTTPESSTPVGVYAAPMVQQSKNTSLPDQYHATLNCNGRGPMRVPLAPKEFGAAVIGVVSSSDALAAIKQGQQRVNGQLDPDYRNSPRVAVHPDKAPYGTNAMAVVPTGMTVTPGQHIVYTTGYADPNYPCHYFPNLVERVDH